MMVKKENAYRLTQHTDKLLFVGMPLAPPLGELPKAEGVPPRYTVSGCKFLSVCPPLLVREG